LIAWPGAQPDYSQLQAPVEGHYAENDDFAGPAAVDALEEELAALGKRYKFFIYPDTQHAFTNHHRPEVYAPEHAEAAWARTLAFFREHVR
jgi:carboxymethylenebutenolidase